MLKIRRPLGRLIFNMGIAIPGKTVFFIKTARCCLEPDVGTSRLIVAVEVAVLVTILLLHADIATAKNEIGVHFHAQAVSVCDILYTLSYILFNFKLFFSLNFMNIRLIFV